MVRRGDDDEEDEGGVSDADGHAAEHAQRASRFEPHGFLRAQALEEARVPEERAANHQRVGEVQTRHGGELVDVHGVADPETLVVPRADGVDETVAGREEAWRHAGPEGEDQEGEEVAEGHCAAHGGEGGVGGGGVVVPGEEAGRGVLAWLVEMVQG